MKALKNPILSKITNSQICYAGCSLAKLVNNQSFSLTQSHNKQKKFNLQNAMLKFKIANFSSNNPNDDDTHSDFQPKSKVEITDDNVMLMIDDWVKNNDVILFMKGTREMPRCGFSNYAVQILKFYNIKEVKVINILENPIVREAVKKYSNWPTYPQLYVKGNLVGIKIIQIFI